MKFFNLIIFLVLLNSSGCSSFSETTNNSLNDFKFLEFDIKTLNNGYVNQEYTIEQVIAAYIDRIKQIDQNGPALNSIIEINPDAIFIAKSLDIELKAKGSRGLLHGIPILLKDNIDTKDNMSTTAGSRALKGSKPLNDSKIAERLRNAGAVILGKTNLSELYNILRNCELYIGPDSGTLHIASMLNKPVIGLFATSNPERTGPIGNMKYTVNKYPKALMEFHKLTVNQAKWGKRIRNKNAMDLITVEEVIKNIDEILKL